MAQILSRNQTEADDLAQETLIKAFAALETFRHGTDARAWLMRILRNARIDRLRSDKRRQGEARLDAGDIEVAAPEPTEAGDTDDIWRDPAQVLNAFSDQQMIDALQVLPEEIRLTLLLVDVQQIDHREAAEILDVPVGTIKSRTHRGRAMLRQALLPLARQMRMVK